jgi:cysteinyl-tRNA synthetase
VLLHATLVLLDGCSQAPDEPPVAAARGAVATAEAHLLGDLDADGAAGVADGTAILRIVVGLDAETPLADCDGNGSAGVSDAIIVLRALVVLTPWPLGTIPRAELLAAVRSWGYQIQALNDDGAIDALAASEYQMLVLEPTNTVVGDEGFDSAAMVEAVKRQPNGRRRLVIAYIDIGQAEDYRYYWQPDWQAPTADEAGDPDFLVTVDPDGWSGNYPVAYWDPRWEQIAVTGPDSLLNRAIGDGFDGIYMDWVEAYDDEQVKARATGDGIDNEASMVAFVDLIGQTARAQDPQFLVIAQNGPDLVTDHPEYVNVIDAIAQEDVHFSGDADTDWDDPASGDTRTPDGNDDWERGWIYSRLDVYLGAGLPVFTCDYCLIPANAEQARTLSTQRGYVPLVTRTPLDRLP